jgi:CheY-like chemotaxis protein
MVPSKICLFNRLAGHRLEEIAPGPVNWAHELWPAIRYRNLELENSSMETPQTSRHVTEGCRETLDLAVAESDRLDRFLTRLLSEGSAVGVDYIEFVTEGPQARGALFARGQTVRHLNIRSIWLPTLIQHLERRWLPIIQSRSASVPGASEKLFSSAVRVGDQIATVRVRCRSLLSGEITLRLDEVRLSPLARVLEHIGGPGFQKDLLAAFDAPVPGAFICGAPDPTQRCALEALLRVLRPASVLVALDEPELRAACVDFSTQAVCFGTMIANDLVHLVTAMRELRAESPEKIVIRGLWCTAFVRRNCEGCSRGSTADQRLLNQLPEFLQRASLEHYAIGRGCDLCGQSGFAGVVGLEGHLVFDNENTPEIIEQLSEQDFVRRFMHCGVRSLLDDGFRKCSQGLTTFGEVLSAVRTAPEIYQALWRAAEQKIARDGGSADSSSGSPRRSDPLGSQPLFRRKEIAPRKENPLVLLVEDDQDQRAIVELALTGSNYRVIEAANGQEALEKLSGEELPDIIVSDLMMPIMDGAEFVSVVKSTPRLHRIPILMLTVVHDEDREYALLELGADDYCEKTVQRKLLLKRIEKLVRRDEERSAG